MWRWLWKLLANERGQLALPAPNWNNLVNLASAGLSPTTTSTPSSGFSWSNLLQPLLNPLLQSLGTNLGNIFTPSGALGTGLTLGGLLQPNDPSINQGAREQAFQFLRNQFTSPIDPFAPGGVFATQLPLLQQQESELLNNIQQRYIAGQPSSFTQAMSGPEIQALRDAAVRQIIPQRQALIAALAERNLNRQIGAAGDLLNFTRPDPLASLLTAGGLGMLGGQGAQAGQLGGLSGTAQSGLLSALRGALGTGGQTMTLGQVGTAADGTPIWGMVPQGGAAGLDFGLPGAGLLGPSGFSSLGGLLSGAGSGLGGYFLGQQVGQNMPNQATGALSGAGTGALTGFAVGGPLGAAIGGLGGLFGGFFGQREREHELKEANLQSDLAAQANAVQQIGNFFGNALSMLGVDPMAYLNFVGQQVSGSEAGPTAFSFGGISGTLDQQAAVAQVGGQLLLRSIQQSNPSITSLDQVAGLRQSFIDQMMASVWNAQNAPAFSISDAGSYAQPAGLKRGGLLPRGGMAVVGEEGPELLRAGPGTEVIPLGQRLTQAFDPRGVSPRSVPQILQALGGPRAYAYGGMRPMVMPLPSATRFETIRFPGRRNLSRRIHANTSVE